MLANLMTAAAAYAVHRGVPLDRVAEAAGLTHHVVSIGPERVPEDIAGSWPERCDSVVHYQVFYGLRGSFLRAVKASIHS